LNHLQQKNPLQRKRPLFQRTEGVSEGEEEEIEIIEEPVSGAEEEISFGDIDEAPTTKEPEIEDVQDVSSYIDSAEEVTKSQTEGVSEGEEEEIEIIEEPGSGAEEEISFGDIDEAPTTKEPEIEDLSEEMTGGAVKEEISTEDEKLDLTESQDKERNIEDAEEFISKGKYLEAMNIYQGILSSNPEDKKALQRIEELKTLFKLMGKDKEALISKLNLFLESINKKRDEFYRGSERDS
jgi:hypothetical protein